MNTKLWQSTQTGQLDSLIEAYTVGNDQKLDQQLLGYDITATKAHAHMLSTIGILDDSEYQALAVALDELFAAWEAGTFIVTQDDEDGHTAIELYLTEKLGTVGKKVHTGRSRNDQALVMMRLYLKDQLAQAATVIANLAETYKLAEKEIGDVPMPGYTHTQKAMPTTVATWLGSYEAAFKDLVPYVQSVVALIDQNPLGSAAGFGISLPLDRTMTTHELGFMKVQENPMYCGLSRGIFEMIAVQTLTAAMAYAGKFAEDMLLFTSQEFGFFTLPVTMTTGSSIMPHKRNYDVFEMVRANAHAFPAYAMQLQSVAGSVGSGYHRDLQLTKGVTLTAFDTALRTFEVLALCVKHIIPVPERLEAAMTDELYSVAKIDSLILQGIPFRDAYKQVKEELMKRS